MSDRQRVFDQYMRGDDLDINENGFESKPYDPLSGPPASQSGAGQGLAGLHKPPLYPQGQGAHTPKVTPGGPPRTPSSTPPPQPVQPTPTPSYQQSSHYEPDAAVVERHKSMLRMQENEIVQLENNAKTLRFENQQLTDRLKAAQSSEGGFKSEYEALKTRFITLQKQSEEAEGLTAEAGVMLHKVQTDLDHAQADVEAVKSEMRGVFERLLPNEELPMVSAPDMIATAGRRLERLITEITEESSDRKALEAEIVTLTASEKQARAEVIKARAEASKVQAEAAKARESFTTNDSSNTEAAKRIKKVERELETQMERNSELVETVTKLQSELAELREQGSDQSITQVARMRAVYEVSNTELQEKIQQLEAEVRRAELTRADEERQRQSLAQLLKKTETALKRSEEELTHERNKSISYSTPGRGDTSQRDISQVELDIPVQGELFKLGMSTGHKPASWTRRWFVADATCLQYFERTEDYERKDPALVKGVRFYASQQQFVSRFRADGLPHDPSTHPKASDPKMYYFGFIPKHDNSLSTQPFLLRTSSRDLWASFCRVLSRLVQPGGSPAPHTPSRSHASFMASPELSGITPPTRHHETSENGFEDMRSGLGNELKKTEETVRVLIAEQSTIKRKMEEAEAEAGDLRENLLMTARDADVKDRTIEIYKKEIEQLKTEASSLKEQMKSLTSVIESSHTEVALLRTELDKKRTQEISIVESQHASTTPVTHITREVGILTEENLPWGTLERQAMEDKLRAITEKNKKLSVEQAAVSTKLKEQEAQHDAQIAAFCDQVMKDMEAVRLHSKMEIQRSDEDWQKEVAIWQQLVAEKEQQIAAAAYKEQSDDELDSSSWKVIGGGSATPTVLSLKLSSTGADFDVSPTTYGTRIAVDKRRLVQVSVSDDPKAKDSMARTWRFKSLNGDHSTVILSLSILPTAHTATRRHSVTSTTSLSRPRRSNSGHSRNSSMTRPPHTRRNSHVFVP